MDKTWRLEVHKLRVYVDNSVFGGVYDEEFTEESKMFFQQVQQGKYLVLVSQVLYDELEGAPQNVRQVLLDIPQEVIEELPITDEVRVLAEEYLKAEVVTRNSINDATQVAIATVGSANFILSWNFRHLLNLHRIMKFNAVNLLQGYHPIDIRSPKEIVYGHGN